MELNIKQVAPLLVISRRERLTVAQIPARSGPAIRSLFESMKRLGIQQAGGGILYIYRGSCNGDPAVEFDLDFCLPIQPVPEPGVVTEPPIEMAQTPPFRCVAGDYVGPMSGIGQAWMNLVRHVRASGHKPTDQSREIYKKWVDFDAADNVTELQQGIA